MGFLDSSTNNIVLDAVLTDAGRKALARNDSSFNIVKFAFSDDDVNYNVITRYGRTVGKERIEKLTPITEALTNQSQAMKYKLISVSNPNLVRLPFLSLSGDSTVDGTSRTITLGRNTQKSSTVSIEQLITSETSIDVELRDQTFIVDVPNLFVQVLRSVPANVDQQQRATYIMTRSPTENSFGGSTLQFTLGVKSVSDSTFAIFGTTSNKSRIKSYVRVTGLQSGAVLESSLVVDKTI